MVDPARPELRDGGEVPDTKRVDAHSVPGENDSSSSPDREEFPPSDLVLVGALPASGRARRQDAKALVKLPTVGPEPEPRPVGVGCLVDPASPARAWPSLV